MFKNRLKLTEDMIKEFNRLLKRNTSDERKEWFRVGAYKSRPNMVGDGKTTEPSKVAQDGNGRVGRIILFKECLKHDILPFIIDHEHKLFYYRGLKEYIVETGYLMDTCLAAQDEYEKTVAYFYPDLNETVQDMI